jgi:predicted RNase H-like HicB family nuclease
MFNGEVWKSKKFWLIEIPVLDIMTQGKSKKNAVMMIKDAIESLVNEKRFKIKITFTKNDQFIIYTNNVAPLIALLLKRQRTKNKLSLTDMQERLHTKSRNAYAQYEQGRSVPSVQKLLDFLSVMGETPLLNCTHLG